MLYTNITSLFVRSSQELSDSHIYGVKLPVCTKVSLQDRPQALFCKGCVMRGRDNFSACKGRPERIFRDTLFRQVSEHPGYRNWRVRGGTFKESNLGGGPFS